MTTHPLAIQVALEHVRQFHPDVATVKFFMEDSECGGLWEYRNIDGTIPAFDERIDVNILERALDAAFEHKPFPAEYEV